MHVFELVADLLRENSETDAVPAWYALQLRRRSEGTTLGFLARKGVQTFLPSRSEYRGWSDRNRRIEVPLFSGYGFVQTQLSPETRLRVLQTEGVIGFVSHLGKAVAIPEKQIQDLRLLAANGTACSVHAELKVGQRVRIRGGCLDGVEGVLADARPDRLFVAMDALNRSVAIRIEGYRLEAA